jgi:hypothetical protein
VLAKFGNLVNLSYKIGLSYIYNNIFHVGFLKIKRIFKRNFVNFVFRQRCKSEAATLKAEISQYEIF